jgi:hypothetical protein
MQHAFEFDIRMSHQPFFVEICMEGKPRTPNFKTLSRYVVLYTGQLQVLEIFE